jgi:DNA-binding NarL/FixJ family response regulator
MPEKGKTNVLIVDDHPLFVKGLAALVNGTAGFAVAGEAFNHEEAVKIARKQKPNLAIIDINLGNESGLELIPKLKTIYPEIVILVISMYEERYYSERILRLGALGYVMKNEAAVKIQEALKTVMDGKIYLSDDERERIFGMLANDINRSTGDSAVSPRRLSDRELQVFSLLGKGFGTIEIASRFGLSTKTIDTHKEHIKLKLRCNTSQQLRQLAIEWTNRAGSY